jgi:hypothetical protein
MCAFYPAAMGESICDDCVRAMPRVVPEQDVVEVTPTEVAVPEPKLDFHSVFGGRLPRRRLHGRHFRNGRVA